MDMRLTPRQQFVKAAMQGLLAGCDNDILDSPGHIRRYNALAMKAVLIADEVMEVELDTSGATPQ